MARTSQREAQPGHGKGEPMRSSRHPRGAGRRRWWLGGCCLAPAAQAGSPVYNYEVVPSNTQAGGHPDLRIADRIRQPLRPAHPAAQLRLPGPEGLRTPPADRLDRRPPRDAAVHPGRLRQRRLPSELAGRHLRQFGLGQAAVYNVQPSPGQAGLLGLLGPRDQFADLHRDRTANRGRLRARRARRGESTTSCR